MNTKIYEYLLAVAEYKNISRAAQHCFISQPALTQHIKKLERSLGAVLFEKNGNNQLIPTRQGEIFLTTAGRMLKIEEETMSRIEKLRQDTPVAYRIFVDIDMRNLLIEQILPKLLHVCPGLQPTLVCGDTRTAWDYLDSRSVDAGVFPLYGEYPSSMDCVSVEHSEYILLLHADHPAADYFSLHGVDMQMLQNETFILNQEFSFFHDFQRQILDYHKFKPARILHSHSMRAAVQMVLDKQGAAFLPNTITSLLPSACRACSFNPPWRFRYVVAYAKKYGLNMYHTQMANLLMEHYRQFHP